MAEPCSHSTTIASGACPAQSVGAKNDVQIQFQNGNGSYKASNHFPMNRNENGMDDGLEWIRRWNGNGNGCDLEVERR